MRRSAFGCEIMHYSGVECSSNQLLRNHIPSYVFILRIVLLNLLFLQKRMFKTKTPLLNPRYSFISSNDLHLLSGVWSA